MRSTLRLGICQPRSKSDPLATVEKRPPAVLAKAEALGGKRLMGPESVGGGDTIIGMFADPEGHVLGVSNTA